MTFLIQFLTDVVFEADCHTPRGIDNWGQTWFKDYVVFVLEPFHCVEAFEILADHVLFFSWVTSCKLYWCRVGHVFVNSKVAYE